MLLGPFLKSTTTAGVEVIFDVDPIDLFAKREATLAAKRIQGANPVHWDGIGNGKQRGHLFEARWE